MESTPALRRRRAFPVAGAKTGNIVSSPFYADVSHVRSLRVNAPAGEIEELWPLPRGTVATLAAA